jgi:transglutaminase-like putative cysteine protease
VNTTLTDRPLSSTAAANGSPTNADTPAPAPPTRPRLPPFHLDVAATLALAAYSAVVAIGFARVFSGWSFARDLAVLIAFGHGGSLLLRRLRVAGWVAVPALLLASVWVLLARRYGATFRWLLPSGETWRLVDLQLDLVRAQFQTAVAPVVYDIGWALLAGVAIVLAVALADAFAFRAEARGEALVPGMVLFVFVAALGSPRLRVAITAGMVGTGVLAVIALRARQDRRRRVAPGRARQTGVMGMRTTVPTMIPVALVTAGIIAIFAGVVGPRLPGAGAEPLFETRGRGDRTTRVISPLVDIRSRLTNTSSVELFRVAADQPAYWRVTTLGDFDGQTFGLPTRRLERVTALEPEPGARVVHQQVQIIALLGQLIPAVADPYQAAGKTVTGADMPPLRQDRDTGSLLSPDELVSGDLYSIVSASPILDPDRLRAAEAQPEVDGVYLGIPDNLPEIVGRLAGEVTAGAPTIYDQAMALQTWFRNEFTYSLEVQQGHSGAAIEAFLDIRVGYCEQFAATFAAMARTLGIPSRVAVGYTPGELTPDNWYSVRGKNAHAWPELYFQGVGWVAFEPTPGRGAPGAESYTRVPAQQDESAGAGAPGGTSSVTIAPPPTVPQRDLGEGALDPVATTAPAATLPEEFDGVDPRMPTPTAVAPDESDGVPWGWLVIYAVAALIASLPWLIRRSYVHAAHRYAPAERVFAAWSRACRAAVCAGVHGADSMTVSQWASATATRLPVAARPMRELAQVVDAVVYGRPGFVDLNRVGSYGSTLGNDCDLWAAQVERVAVDELTTSQRLRRYFTDIRRPAKSASWL